MEDASLLPAVQPPLSEGARVVDTFVAPAKTFTDILRSASCWLPLLIMLVLTVGWAAAVDHTVGYTAATENQIAKNPKQEEAMQGLTTDQRARQLSMGAKFTRISMYGSIVFVLIFMAIEALILWGVYNFALGANTTFPQVFAVIAYAGLPRALIWVISSILLLAGVGLDNFDLRNPVGTNLGFYVESPKWLHTAGTFLDVFGIWSLVLLAIGMAIIARKTLAQSATVIFGLWLLILLIATGFSAAFS
jgi:hypothetical protein